MREREREGERGREERGRERERERERGREERGRERERGRGKEKEGEDKLYFRVKFCQQREKVSVMTYVSS